MGREDARPEESRRRWRECFEIVAKGLQALRWWEDRLIEGSYLPSGEQRLPRANGSLRRAEIHRAS